MINRHVANLNSSVNKLRSETLSLISQKHNKSGFDSGSESKFRMWVATALTRSECLSVSLTQVATCSTNFPVCARKCRKLKVCATKCLANRHFSVKHRVYWSKILLVASWVIFNVFTKVLYLPENFLKPTDRFLLFPLKLNIMPGINIKLTK